MKNRVLLVEDEATLASIISDTLTGEGFNVTTACDGVSGLELFKREGADVVVADVMMPRMDGFEMGRRLREINPDIPLLFLTARSSIDDIVTGFEIGANDYLKKPFKMLELIVRIKALLRRRDSTAKRNEVVYEIGCYSFNTTTQILSNGDKSVELSHIEALILQELAANIGETVEASTLMERVWQRDDIYNRNSLHGFIHKLRRYLRNDSSISIINQRGFGYKLTVK